MNWRLALITVLCLWAAAPPAWFPGGGFLVLVGWMAFYAAIADGVVKRAKLQAYLVGAIHMAAFSFSVRHVMWEAFFGIVLLGGLYYVLMLVWTRAATRYLPGALAFGLALAGAHWLRGHFTDIQYPHCQPVHCLYRFPDLLGSLTWGSEIFANLLIGILAAGLVDLYRAWRVGTPDYRRSVLVLVAVVLVFFATMISPGAVPARDQSVKIAALEPGISSDDFWAGRVGSLMSSRVLQPSRELAIRQPPPDLLVWPESIAIHRLTGLSDPPQLMRARGAALDLPDPTRLLTGSDWVLGNAENRGVKVVALLTDARGRYLGHQEKRRLVPGGEQQPFLGWLPGWASEQIRGLFEWAMGGELPDVTPGESRPLLATATGIRFGAMVCFDNAYPEVTEELVGMGASFIVVISNEAWYRGGAELDQMEAMTVCRALECRIPILRCTVDGASMLVEPSGRVSLRLEPQKSRSSRFLQVDLAVSSGGHRAVPPLHTAVRWVVLLALLALIRPLLASRGRLFRGVRSADSAVHS